jgi:hypothetical protein
MWSIATSAESAPDPYPAKANHRTRSAEFCIRLLKTTGGANGRRLGHGRVVKTSGLKTKTIYRTRGGPTDSGGKGLASYRSTGTTFPNSDQHHEGRHH